MKKFLSLLLLLPVLVMGQMKPTVVSILRADGKLIPAVQYLLPVTNPAGTYPLVVFLPGAGENTTSAPNINLVLNNGNHANLLRAAEQRGFLVLAPQFIQSYNNWEPDWKGARYVDDVIEWAKKNLPVDPRRIYLTGLSQGGGGTWDYLIRDIKFTSKIAAAVPVCPAPQDGNWSLIAQANLPVWSWHANDDNRNPVTATLDPINLLNNFYKIVPTAQMTIFPSGMFGKDPHSIWGTVYDPVGNKKLYDWLLAQKRDTVIIPPVPPIPAKTVVSRIEVTVYSDGSWVTRQLP